MPKDKSLASTKSVSPDSQIYQIIDDPVRPGSLVQNADAADQSMKSSYDLRIRPRSRLASLDAFRGLIMILLLANGFGIVALSRKDADHPVWHLINRESTEWFAFHFQHPSWQSSFVPGTHDASIGSQWLHFGVSFWDLIQPAFMFMVGVAMPYSFTRRVAFGLSLKRVYFHAFARAVCLVLLGVFLYSLWGASTNWVFTNVLAQIGLGYFFVTLLVGRKKWIQYVSLGVILVGSWIGVHVYHPDPEIDPASVNASVERGEIFMPPYHQWSKNLNSFHAFDQWFLNLFPRSEGAEPFTFNGGGYQTLNFIPAMGTMLLGLLCGEFLMSPRTPRRKFWLLMLAAMICLVLGVAAGATCCPIVKRIWTPSWVLFSGGYVIAMLAMFYLVFDILPFKRLAFPLVVIGMNSTLVYLIGEVGRNFILANTRRHFEWAMTGTMGALDSTFHIFRNAGLPSDENGEELYLAFQPVIDATAMVIVVWLLCYFLYRQRVFIRL